MSTLQIYCGVNLLVTEKIEDFLDDYCHHCTINGRKTDKQELIVQLEESNKKTIPFHKLRALIDEVNKFPPEFGDRTSPQELRDGAGSCSKVYLHELLEGSSIYIAPIKEPERNPELVKRLERLKKEQEQAEYNKMVENVSANAKKDNFGKELGEAVRTTSQEVASIINFIVSVAGCFTFAYYASRYAFGDLGLQLIFSIVVATVVALAELYFMARSEI